MVIILGATAFLKTMEKAGVEYIFGTPGTTEMPLIYEMENFPGIKYILALHESVATGMADGYARASGKPGIVSVHSTVGTANTLGMIINSFTSDSPVVVTAGIKDSRVLGSGVFCDSVYHAPDILRQYTRRAWQVLDPSAISRDTATALCQAFAAPGGPVFLAIPENFWTMEAGDKVISMPGQFVTRTRCSKKETEKVAGILAETCKLVILSGNEVGKKNALDLVVKLAEKLGAPVFTEETMAAEYCNFPTDHPLYMGNYSPGSTLIRKADLILGLGAKMFMPFSKPKMEYISPHTRLIEVCAAPDRTSIMYPAELSIVADVSCFLEDLLEAIDKLSVSRALRCAWQTEVKSVKASRDSKLQEYKELAWERLPISAVRLVCELSAIATMDCAIIDEGITLSPFLQNYFTMPSSRSYFAYKGGCLGWGIPSALGVKLHRPKRQVIAFVGDGSLLFSVQSLWTAARYGIGVKIIVCNNTGYMAINSFKNSFSSEIGTSGKSPYGVFDSPSIDFIALASSFGIPCSRVEHPKDLGPILQKALYSPGPEMVEVIIDPQDSLMPPPDLRFNS